VRQHLAGEAWGDHVEVYFGPGFEAYVTPVDGGVNVAWLWDEGRVAPGADVHRQLLKHVAPLEQRLDGRRPTDRPRAAGPFRHRPLMRVRDGVLLMGDAAGYLDPLTGEGVGLALMQAELFGQHVVPLIRDRSERVVPARACTFYLRAVDSASRSNHVLTRLMLSLTRRPAMVERAAAALAADPGLFGHLLAANTGRRSLWTVPLASICRLPFAMLAARPRLAADVRRLDGAGERPE
jgi:flavin-dependent dehydrogenase